MNLYTKNKRPAPIKDKRSAERLKQCSVSELLAGMLGISVAVETAAHLNENAISATRLRQLVIELRSRIDPQPLGDGLLGHKSPRRPKPDLLEDLLI